MQCLLVVGHMSHACPPLSRRIWNRGLFLDVVSHGPSWLEVRNHSVNVYIKKARETIALHKAIATWHSYKDRTAIVERCRNKPRDFC